jgi:hypothetical protein
MSYLARAHGTTANGDRIRRISHGVVASYIHDIAVAQPKRRSGASIRRSGSSRGRRTRPAGAVHEPGERRLERDPVLL